METSERKFFTYYFPMNTVWNTVMINIKGIAEQSSALANLTYQLLGINHYKSCVLPLQVDIKIKSVLFG